MPEVVRRTVTRELLTALERRHPIEAAMAHLLIREGTWRLVDGDGEEGVAV